MHGGTAGRESRASVLCSCQVSRINPDGKPYYLFNPYLTNGFSHCYHLDESTFTLRDARGDFYYFSHFSVTFPCANRIAPNGTPRSAASHLGLSCLPMSHKRDASINELK